MQKTIIEKNTPNALTQYVGNYVCKNNELQFFNHAEGYVEPVIASGSAAISFFNYVYQYKDHLGNIRLSYTDADGNGTIKQDEIIEENNYYPFGLEHKGYNNVVNGAENNYYNYNGKELNESLGLNLLEYEARSYDPAIGRWTSVDPLADKYYKFSPYVYVGNSPTIAVDPDGKRILFVNGYWNSWIGGLIGSSNLGKKYWGSGFTSAAQRFFGDYSSVSDSNYIDGSSSFGGDSSGGGREKDGYAYAKANYTTLTDGLAEDETFKLVTHSEGGAYGARVARYLIEKGHTVETVLHLSTDEGDEFETPEEADTYQLSYGGDWVTGNKEISKGVDIIGVVDKYEKKSDKNKYAHGSTKGSSVFKSAKALLKAAASGATGVNVTETKSGIKFEFIRDNN